MSMTDEEVKLLLQKTMQLFSGTIQKISDEQECCNLPQEPIRKKATVWYADDLLDKRDELDEEIKRALNELSYNDYLRTKHWKKTRQDAIIRAMNRCQLCSSRGKLHVHHNTYKRRGFEEPFDLIVLCEVCHAKHHGKNTK